MVACVVVICLFILGANAQDVNKQITQLITQWAPLIWLSPEEKFLPSSVDYFLPHVHTTNENDEIVQRTPNNSNNSTLFLVTNNSIDKLLANNSSFLYGKNPKETSVPVYVVVTQCTPYVNIHSTNAKKIKNDIDVIYGKVEPNLFFHVSYWLFYPYNEGKEICFIGNVPTLKIFNTCFGHLKTMGNHVGDWEHMSLSFMGAPTPDRLYLAVHNSGVYYKYQPKSRIFRHENQLVNTKYPPIIRMQGGHPVLFAAEGSHGLWASPGAHDFFRIPRLTDVNGYGIPWKTWNNVITYFLDKSILPEWMYFNGRWGNPKTNCLLFKKLGLCEYSDGPPGILQHKQDFFCSF